MWNSIELRRLYLIASMYTSTIWQDRIGAELEILGSRRLTYRASVDIWESMMLIQRLAYELDQIANDWEGQVRHKNQFVPCPTNSKILYVDYDLCNIRFRTNEQASRIIPVTNKKLI